MNWNKFFAPVRRWRDYRGRSDRGELVSLWAYFLIVGAILMTLAGAAGNRSDKIFELATSLILLVPSVPLFIRRFHDVGWSGWWLLPTLPVVAYNAAVQAQRIVDPYFSAAAEGWMFPDYIHLPLIGYAIAVMILLFWNDQIGPNRFGPNPRDIEDDQRAASPG